MSHPKLHPWEVSIHEAISIQQKLRKKIILSNKLLKIKRIAAVDVGFSNNQSVCVVSTFGYPELNPIETIRAKGKISFPYIPGLLTFREGPVIVASFRKLKSKPDLVFFDGQGICHPRRMGIATHLGIVLDVSSIGCAKSHLCGVYEMPKDDKGNYSLVYDNNTKEVLGAVLRTRNKVKPIFVSCGHKVSLKQAIKIVLKLCPKYRIPEPLRYVHHLAKNAGELSI